jgi:hypothetical protein
MRRWILGICFFVAVVLPTVGNSQVTYRPTPPPLVNAASASWQINGEPIFFAGSFYYPTGPSVFFDGQLMARIGEYLTVPVYADTTLEAFSRVFVPIGGAVMKPYERRRSGPLAGTVGSTTPSWPVQVASNTLQVWHGVGNRTGEPFVVADAARPVVTTQDSTRAVGTSGSIVSTRPAGPTAVESVPRPSRNTGISIEFQGAQWVSAGSSLSFVPGRFILIGDHRGFPVYRSRQGSDDTIWVTVVSNGPVAPYTRREGRRSAR